MEWSLVKQWKRQVGVAKCRSKWESAAEAYAR